MSHLNRLLIVEDQPKDLRVAKDAAISAGITEIDARTTIAAARKYLEMGLQKEGPLPDGIILDLDLGYDSGFELLRYWHSTPELANIPVIVWSVLGNEYAEMCKLFKVKCFVGKWEGARAIQDALASLENTSS